MTLFQEAQGAEITLSDIGSVSGSSATITADVRIPAGERVPVAGVSAVVETNPDGLTTKTATTASALVERADCNTPTQGCTNAQLDREKNPAGRDDVIQSVAFTGFFALDTGYSVSDGYFHTFGYGTQSFNFDGGYGYHPTAGFGYGLEPGPGAYTDFDRGYGYDDEGGLIMRYTITIQPSALDNADYWFTLVAHTGTTIQSGMQSPAQSFTVSSTTGGRGPAGGGGDNGGGSGDEPTSIVDAGQLTDLPSDALEGWRASVTGETGDKIQINTGSDRVPRVDFTLSGDADDADVDVVVFPSDSPPAGTPAATWRGAFIVQITISTGGEDHTVEIFVEIDADDMEEGDEGNAFGAKHMNPWVPQSKVDLTLDEDTSKYTGSFSASCCSVFMVGFDEEDPTVSLTVPAGPLSGMATLEAEVDDDVQVDRVEFYAGSTLIGTATQAPYTVDWDTTTVDDGDLTLRAVAHDIVGNENEDSQSVQVQQTDDDGGPAGEPSKSFPWWLIILIAIIVIGGAIWYAASQKKK